MKGSRFRVYLLLFAIFGLLSIDALAQDPIHWAIEKERAQVRIGISFKVQVVAKIDEGWHLYSLDQPAGGPIPTRLIIPNNQKFKLAGEIESPLPQVVFDSNFKMETQLYEEEAVFNLPIEALKEATIGKNTFTIN